MNSTDAEEHTSEQRSGLVPLAVISLIVGAATGALGSFFRYSLERADILRDGFIAWAHTWHVIGFVLVVVAASVATALAAWLVRRFSPEASGSGIPHVESVLNGDQKPASIVLIPVKFVGGVLAIGAGLALGREGPTVQMGATIAHLFGTFCRRNAGDCRVLLAAGAGAGLATAFNAPIAGAVFVLEELVRRFETRTAVAALGASAGAIAIARLVHGDIPDFQFDTHEFVRFRALPAHLVLGIVVGVIGVAYCRAILWALAVADRLGRVPVEARAAAIGAAVGLLAWLAPAMAGGGDPITQRMLSDTGTLSGIVFAFAVRFVLGPLSYAALTPGGLFAPLLVLGAQAGVVFGRVCADWFPALAAQPGGFAVVAMAAFFTAVVRAPVTGIVLVTEMTGGFTLLLPMLVACFTAMVVPMMLGCEPIYDSLGKRAGQQARQTHR
ncbi:voltage-gated ClC-type chloride channel ClcB [Caballeronia terrestris]|uniref:Voltage-gated ClC-type chloride channel ClcB n=1 Tax=Caballeronia terrestris TaxID=1226301 RepID=A0A158KM54_9BURK|nr:H(+)/Cl(-) exchange transporter ClcA [Caballeronia terrestris]SAL81803.1 voltage-gated ClC-type chloride channel ClcB [Caballeronia terrestris]